MPTAGVVIDDYKLDTFKKHLDAGGFKYTQHPGITKGTITLKVECDSPEHLKPTIVAAQQEVALIRAPKGRMQ